MPDGVSFLVMRDTNNEEGCSFYDNPERNLRITVCANQGGRKYMEDRVHIEHIRSTDGTQDYTYVAVYDGHGGADASEFVRKNLLKNIQKQEGFNQSDEEMLQAIRKGFIETHYSMLKVVDGWPLTASGYTSTAGTTASVAFIAHGKVFTGHVGDSAIIVGKKRDCGVSGVCLTVDHKPDNLNEEERINKAGGMVMRKSGVMRVVWTRPLKGHVGPVRRSTPTESIAFLAVARSLGDLWSYNKETKQFIVSPEPDVSVYVLDRSDICLVLGSDGLTNVLKPQQIADIVNTCEKDTDLSNRCLVNHSRVLLRTALQGWGTLRADNITVVTVLFDNTECDTVNDPLYESIAQKSAFNMNLDQAFTKNQTALVRITAKCCQEFFTVPVTIVYTGALDQQFTSDVGYSGPGFSKQIVRDNPILPSKSSIIFTHLRRSASYNSVPLEDGDRRSYCYCSIDYCDPSVLRSGVISSSKANCNDETAESRAAEDHAKTIFHSESLYTSVPSLDPKSIILSSSESADSSCATLHPDPEESPEEGTENCEVNEQEIKKINVDAQELTNGVASSSTFFIEKSLDSESQEPLNNHGYASPKSKPIAVVSPFETTPTSSGRKRLIPFRRARTSFLRKCGAARRNLIMNVEFTPQNESSEEKALEKEFEFKENGTSWHEEVITESSAEEDKLINHRNRRSLGGASALSPVLMLAALRTPDQLLLNRGADDPLRREVTSFRYARYCSSVITPTTSRLGQLKLGDESSTTQSNSAPDASSPAQKRKAEVDDNANVAMEPASKRSRLWGFFSSLIGERKPK